MEKNLYNTLHKPLAFYPFVKFDQQIATHVPELKFENSDVVDTIPFYNGITSQYFTVLDYYSKLGQTLLDTSRNLTNNLGQTGITSFSPSLTMEDFRARKVHSLWSTIKESDKTVVYSPYTRTLKPKSPLAMYLNKDSEGVKSPADERSSKIWRPFSPESDTPSSSTVKRSTELKGTIPKVGHGRFLPTILPSSVKLGESSVFKAVKKKKYQCRYCDQWYLNNGQLAGHIRAHIGSKPYRCEYPGCFRAFARNEELTRHRRIHSGVKPHQCDVCQKRFGRKDHLNKHKKTHMKASEKKIYLCEVPGCKHRYTRSDALTRHLSTAHSIKHQRSTSNSAGRSRLSFTPKKQDFQNGEQLYGGLVQSKPKDFPDNVVSVN